MIKMFSATFRLFDENLLIEESRELNGVIDHYCKEGGLSLSISRLPFGNPESCGRAIYVTI